MHDTPASPTVRRDSDTADDLVLAEEAHDLISHFLDIEDAQVRRRCIDYVRRAARGPAGPSDS